MLHFLVQVLHILTILQIYVLNEQKTQICVGEGKREVEPGSVFKPRASPSTTWCAEKFLPLSSCTSFRQLCPPWKKVQHSPRLAVLIHCGSARGKGVGVRLGPIAEEINARIPCMCCFWQRTKVQSCWSSEMTNRQQKVPYSGIERKRRRSEEGQRRPEINLRSFSTVNLTNQVSTLYGGPLPVMKICARYRWTHTACPSPIQ